MLGINTGVINQKSTPALITDIIANRPVSASPGAVFFATDTTTIEQYINGAWIAYSFGGTGVTSITGTANQVIASASTGNVVLSLPQNIATNSSPTFASINIGNVPSNYITVNGSQINFYNGANQLQLNYSGSLTSNYFITIPKKSGIIALLSDIPSSYVSSITGTANQVNASASTGNVVLSLPQDIATSSSPTFALINTATLQNGTTSGNQVTIKPFSTSNASIIFNGITTSSSNNFIQRITGTYTYGSDITGTTLFSSSLNDVNFINSTTTSSTFVGYRNYNQLTLTANSSSAILGVYSTVAISATSSANETSTSYNAMTSGVFYSYIISGATGTINTLTGLFIRTGNSSATATLVNSAAIVIQNPYTTGTLSNYSYIVLGSATFVSGNWTIYNYATYNNYFGNCNSIFGSSITDLGYTIQSSGIIYTSQGFIGINTRGFDNIGYTVSNDTLTLSSSSGTETTQSAYSANYGAIGFQLNSNKALYSASVYSGLLGSAYFNQTGNLTGGIISGIATLNFAANSGNVDTYAGIRVLPLYQQSGQPTYSGTITEYAGIYIDDLTTGNLGAKITNAYAIHQKGVNDINLFAGEIRIGNTVSASVVNTVTNKVKMIVNGTTYYLLASTSNA